VRDLSVRRNGRNEFLVDLRDDDEVVHDEQSAPEEVRNRDGVPARAFMVPLLLVLLHHAKFCLVQ
jgi:hypothetical protein